MGETKPRRRLLVVDDSPGHVNLLVKMLGGEYDVTVAHGGEEAIEIVLGESPPEIVLLDIVMPEMDGIEVLKKIRDKRGMMELPVIMVTSKRKSEDLVGALSLGANDYLTKPVDFGIARARIGTQIRLVQTRVQLEKAQRDALRASNFKSEFLAGMSHEIRTPMNAIIGVTDLMSETELDPEQKEFVQIMRSAGKTLIDLINDILDLSKIEAGRLELESVDFSVVELADETIKAMETGAREKGLELKSAIGREAPDTVRGDSERLRRILTNLIGNAVKFTDRGGVTLRVEKDPDSDGPAALRFIVSDTGIGVPEDRREAIFDNFSQADSSSTRQYGGTGLGLAICRRLTELMGGKIRVESEPGKGNSFIFTAAFEPAEPARAEAAAEVRPEPEAPQSSSGPRILNILLVDDDPANRIMVKAFIKKTPHRVDEAENGQIAVDKFKAGDYDLVFMDMQMPIKDGLTATREIRAWETQSGRAAVPIVALTAHALAEHIERSIEAGCDDHLTKPIRQDLFLSALDKYTVA